MLKTFDIFLNAKLYDRLLSEVDEVELPSAEGEVKPVYHLYVIKANRRDELTARLQKNGDQCEVHYPLLIPLQPIYRQVFSFEKMNIQ